MFKKRLFNSLAWGIIALSSPVASMSGSVQARDIAVILNQGNFESLSEQDIVNIFTGKLTQYPNYRTPIEIAIVDDAEVRNFFNDQVLNQSSRELKKTWSRLIFTGKVNPPRVEESIESIIDYVAQNENAVAYVPLEDVTNNVRIAFIYRKE